ncbi:hypothetical protein HOLleu_17118 [Holothuria leucospilota]|uniref:Uncharacterized protein n=1 Tax=Holothuria leucospilota TaxID=206669 RepID=A0A9Q1C533_HOLLE|nr:hypothetical protein HOLleu_17118 [Holothuria leucospilota]
MQFRILTYVYKCLHHLAPIYLENLICVYEPGCALRSTDCNYTLVEYVPRRKFGGQSFSVAGPCLWNDIPAHIKESASLQVFQKLLNTQSSFCKPFLLGYLVKGFDDFDLVLYKHQSLLLLM